MTDNSYPFVPPLKLIKQWRHARGGLSDVNFAAKVAEWAANQELEACCQWINDDAEALRLVRRPSQPSLKEQAIKDLTDAYNADQIDDTTYENILCALEQEVTR